MVHHVPPTKLAAVDATSVSSRFAGLTEVYLTDGNYSLLLSTEVILTAARKGSFPCDMRIPARCLKKPRVSRDFGTLIDEMAIWGSSAQLIA